LPDALFYILAYLITGALSGLLAGLLGLGGGLVIVPALTYVLTLQGYPVETVVHMAIGTSLAVITVTSLVSTYSHHRLGHGNWPLIRQLAPTLAVGALLGAAIAHWMPGTALRLFVGLFELWVALRIAIKPQITPVRPAPSPGESRLAGASIGTLSTLVGIGGGTLTVPYLLHRNIRVHQAIAVSAACGFPIALVGSLGYMAFAWNDANAVMGSLGHVLLPAFVPISIASMAFAPLGAKLAHSLSGPALKRGFAGFMAIAGVLMLAG
jgi:uncharacterized membrane protein YfcA